MAKTILYTIQISNILAVKIPRKYKKGYLKSAFGGHHYNEANSKFDEYIAEITDNDYSADVFDIDGYLAFQGRFNDEEISDIMEALKKTFPYCTEEKRLTLNEFTDTLLWG